VAFIHIAGTPCTAWSDMGLLDGENAISTAYFLVWIGLRLLCEEPIVIQENVVGFPKWLIADLLPMYFVEWIVLSPYSLGWPIERQRQWLVLFGLLANYNLFGFRFGSTSSLG
jgi:site-specific DNA-cytosine methylase